MQRIGILTTNPLRNLSEQHGLVGQDFLSKERPMSISGLTKAADDDDHDRCM